MLMKQVFIKDSSIKHFHTFENRHVYDIIFTNISNNGEIYFTITHTSMEPKTQFYVLNKKFKNARENSVTFNQIKKLLEQSLE